MDVSPWRDSESPLRGQALLSLPLADPTDVSPWSFSRISGSTFLPELLGGLVRLLDKNVTVEIYNGSADFR